MPPFSVSFGEGEGSLGCRAARRAAAAQASRLGETAVGSVSRQRGAGAVFPFPEQLG